MGVQDNTAKRTILCYGDSNTWGRIPGEPRRRFPHHVRWPGVLFRLLRTEYRVIEQGLGGRTTVFDDPIESPFGVEKNGSRLLGAVLESHAPLDLVVIMLGTNDLKRRFAAPAVDIAAGVGVLVRKVRASGCGRDPGAAPDVLVVCPPAIWEVEANFGSMFQGGREKSLSFPDVFHAMSEKVSVPVLYTDDLIQSDHADGIHLSAESHGLLGAEVARWVLERYQSA